MAKAKSLVALTLILGVVVWPSNLGAAAQDKINTAAVAKTEKLPVKEVTIFKDGHALVVREGVVPLNGHSEAVLDDLPSPLLGTFLPYSLDSGQPLISVTAGKRKVETSATALSVSDFLEANPGAEVTLTQPAVAEHSQPPAVIGKLAPVPVPRRSIEELNNLKEDSTAAGATSPQRSGLVEVDSESGATFLPIDKIESFSFKGKHSPTVKSEELKNVLTLKLAQTKASEGASARVGMMYVQSGLRWMPSYKIVLNGKGTARIKLEATLINDLADLDDVTTQLVVGVPSFVANGETDPIALSKSLAEVANHMDRDAFSRRAFSNSIMTQTASTVDAGVSTPRQEDQTVVDNGSKSEDLFVFGVKHVSLRKGERMVVPVLEAEVPYEDLYTLDIPITPPPEVQSTNPNAYRSSESAGQNGLKPDESLKFLHKVRLKNTLPQPFTTAPALLIENSQGKEVLLAQSLITYAPQGSASDLTVTTAVDLKAVKHENEVGRQDSATTWLANKYARINVEGAITVTNYGAKPVKIEVNRKVLGQVDSVSAGGSMQMLNALNEGIAGQMPFWWGYYSWPNWWTQMNGLGKFTFQSELAPRQKAECSYKWHYYWR